MNSTERMWNAINSFNWGNGKELHSMTTSECISLIDNGRDKFELTVNAFKYGFIKGIRYQKAQEKKKRKGVKA
ncbi:MAG: hypothetical protein V8Q36_03340 [Anaerotignum sp.]